jgi:hypothetical protein
VGFPVVFYLLQCSLLSHVLLLQIGYLESLPETHSLALDTVRPNPTSSSGAAAAAEGRIASSSSPGKEQRGSSSIRNEGTDGSSCSCSSALQGNNTYPCENRSWV